MVNGQWGVVLRHVQRLFQGEGVAGLSEGQLLERFASTRDEAAFEGLLARHGPMVLGVCRGVLDDPHDVDDAFQATFLVLVKKAGALRDGDRLAQWLYGVARRVALRARSDSRRRKARDRPEAGATVESRSTLDAELRELQALIREEVDRLSSNDRMAVVLCYLEGLTHEEAADRLGWPVGTVKGRLSRAREKLRGRLTRRGVALPAAAVASTLAKGAKAAVPLELIRSTTLAATRVAAGKTLTAGIVSAQAITLMEGVIGTMFATKLKVGAAALVATCVVGAPGVLAFQGRGPADVAGETASQDLQKAAVGKADLVSFGKTTFALTSDPGQDQEARLASEAMEKAEKAMMSASNASYQMEKLPIWSRRLVEAKIGPGTPEPGRKAALQAHRDRMRHLFELATELVKGEASGLTELDVMEAKYRLIEADRWLKDGRIGVVGGLTPTGGGFSDGIGSEFGNADRKPLVLKTMPGDEKRNQAILAKLEKLVSMNFEQDTPLEDVKKYVEQATQDEAAGLPTGIPIYVDPIGLQDADKTMASTVTLRLEGIPLRTSLHLVLHQLSLDYRVEGGLLLIVSEDDMPAGATPGPGFGRGGLGGGFR